MRRTRGGVVALVAVGEIVVSGGGCGKKGPSRADKEAEVEKVGIANLATLQASAKAAARVLATLTALATGGKLPAGGGAFVPSSTPWSDALYVSGLPASDTTSLSVYRGRLAEPAGVAAATAKALIVVEATDVVEAKVGGGGWR